MITPLHLTSEMLAFFAAPYTIHFDDTMAYGSHHFLTGFKFQCEAREAFLFGERVFDQPGVRDALEGVHLLTLDAYSRNLNSAVLGDRIAILLSLEEWGQASARFCYRAVDAAGRRICAGFQMLVCADALTGEPMGLPASLREAMDAMREIEEPHREVSFRDRVLAGGQLLDEVFGDDVCELAKSFLSVRNASSRIIHMSPAALIPALDSDGVSDRNESRYDIFDRSATFDRQTPAVHEVQSTDESLSLSVERHEEAASQQSLSPEAWVFAGQGSFQLEIMRDRIDRAMRLEILSRSDLEATSEIVSKAFEFDASPFFHGTLGAAAKAVEQCPNLVQIGIHLQNVLGAELLCRAAGESQVGASVGLESRCNPSVVLGHSFGEVAAFAFSGCLGLLDGVRAVCSRVRSVESYGPTDSGLLAVMLPRHDLAVEIALSQLPNLVVAGRNSKSQTILSGPKSELSEIQSQLSVKGISSVNVPSPTSFHHRELLKASEHWLTELRGLDWQVPRVPVYTPIGRRFINSDEDFAQILASQFLLPFDFQGALEDLGALGIETFVDCGSKGNLASVIARVGEGRWVIRQERRDESLATLPVPAKQASVDHSVAIVGMGCALPAGSTNPERLFEAIENQQVGIVDMRDEDPHWERDFYSHPLVSDRSTSFLFGKVRDRDISPPQGVDRRWFEKLTRTQKLICMALAPCIAGSRDAKKVVCLFGATADGFEDQDVEASMRYAGICSEPIGGFGPALNRPDTARNVGFGGDQQVDALRTPHQSVRYVVDHLLGEEVEVILIDAACASSLYTVSLGMDLIQTGQADAVIAGGFFCPGPGNSCLFSQFGGMTSTGCRPFDHQADGVVFSEGAAFITLRNKGAAGVQGLPVHAVLRAAGLSSDGRSSSANVPQSKGQILSLMRAYDRYAIKPSSIDAIEGHGTSTPVGDSTEIDSLHQFFKGAIAAGGARSPIPVHSLKGILGHAGWAAGSASIIAACMYIAKRKFPGQAFFTTPSRAVQQSSDVLSVSADSRKLPANELRIAVDGFGFGGANAHMVVESPDAAARDPHLVAVDRPGTINGSVRRSDIVVVATDRIEPDMGRQGATAHCFDRAQIDLSKDFIVLPELLDDMDISQKLAALIGKRTLAKLPNFSPDLRANTGVVLAMSDKTERGVEATFRVLYERLSRNCNRPKDRNLLKIAYDKARPSGPYTLQCMMPNVASGRAALLLDLNGPNFVVDGGGRSLVAAFESASLLLQGGSRGGTQVVLVEGIQANAFSLPDQLHLERKDECAVAYALTTRDIANEYQWPVLAACEDILQELALSDQHSLNGQTAVADSLCKSNDSAVAPVTLLRSRDASSQDLATQMVRDVIETSSSGGDATADAEEADVLGHPIFTPIWSHAPKLPASGLRSDRAAFSAQQTGVVVRANVELLDQILKLEILQSALFLAVVGADAVAVAKKYPNKNILPIEAEDLREGAPWIEKVLDYDPAVLLLVHEPSDWNVSAVLPDLGAQNDVGEFAFLWARASTDRLRSGALSIWQLVFNGWKGVVHPNSGAVAGFLKAVSRENPNFIGGTVVTGSCDLAEAVRCVADEIWSAFINKTAYEPEVVYDALHRKVRRLTRVSGKGRTGPRVKLDANSVVVATGGGKGVTAVMLEAIAKEYRCKIIALGRSAIELGASDAKSMRSGSNGCCSGFSQEGETEFYRQFLKEHPGSSIKEMKRRFEQLRAASEVCETLERLRHYGSEVEYRVVDVGDRSSVDATIKDIASRFGRIDLVLHGAGVQYSKKLEDRSLDEFRQTYSTKVSGLSYLFEATERHVDRPVVFHPLTSAFSLFGNDGQHDYGAANETMDRICDLARTADDLPWFSIAWLAWDGVGMTRGSEYQTLAKSRGLSGVDPATGQQIFTSVLHGRTDAAINVPMTDSEHREYKQNTVPSVRVPSRDANLFEFPQAIDDYPLLENHLVRGIPTVPGAWILNAFVKSGLSSHPSPENLRSVCLEQVQFHRFVRFGQDNTTNYRIIIESGARATFAWMICDIEHSSGHCLAKDVLCSQAKLNFSQQTVDRFAGSDIALVGNVAEHQSSVSSWDDPYCRVASTDSLRTVELSGAFDCIRNIQIGDSNRSARIVASQPAEMGDSRGFCVPAIELDAAWRVGAMHSGSSTEQLFAPTQVGQIWLPLCRFNCGGLAGARTSREYCVVSLSPDVSGEETAWQQTDVIDSDGALYLRVLNAKARSLG